MNPMRSTWMSGCAVLLALLYCSVSQAAQRPDPNYNEDTVTVTDAANYPGKGPVIAVDRLHNNFHTISGKYQGFELLLEKDGNVVDDFDLVDFDLDYSDLDEQYFTDCTNDLNSCEYYQALSEIDVLVIANAQEPIFVGEAAVIAGWVSGELDDCLNCSRSLFLIADHPDYPSYISELSAVLGLYWPNDSQESLIFVLNPDPATEGKLDTSHVITQGRYAAEAVTEVETFTGSYFEEYDPESPLAGGVPVLRLLDENGNETKEYQGMAFRHGRGSVYASAEAAMFTAQRSRRPDSPQWTYFGMQTTNPCPLEGGITPNQEHCNEQYLLNIGRWFSGKLDTDDDGVIDGADDCRDETNPNQCDTDVDGFGNICDADINNDGIVGGPDQGEMTRCMFVSCSEDPSCCAADLNCDGVVGGPDQAIFTAAWLEPPGPSGLDCAGTIPCLDSDYDAYDDSVDNCTEVYQDGAEFCDDDADGYGNMCDADFNNDGVYGGPDYAEFTRCLGVYCSEDPTCCAVDLNCDGAVGGPDFALIPDFGEPPGPSGLDCAGTIPCN